MINGLIEYNYMENKTILISGSAGFLGSHIADSLIEQGHLVIGLDDLSSGKLENVNKQEAFFQMDLSECGKLFDRYKIDIVIHCAAQTNVRVSIDDPITDAMENIFGSLALFEEMKKHNVKRIIFLSTGGAIYGDANTIPTPETEEAKPVSPYGIAKYSIENYLRFYREVHGFQTTILRLANVYGPRATKGIINLCIDRFKKGEKMDIYGGYQTRDYLFVSDVVSAVQTVIEFGAGLFNVGTGCKISLTDLVETICIGKPEWKKLINKCPRIKGELLHSSLDSYMLENLGWKHAISLEEGIKKLKKI